ncbi:hypothetical protein B0T21DRAFT_347779 [Apiosordaria backusii]|uniref:Uncharacterized protein n=1 Tax=Apiosordaria backusii TaxID=314023 RepID=A0AA40BNM3_9PEZI|nr:hypothetical protein B0T21DRAFT_347779 [Apiosordaria backusii]
MAPPVPRADAAKKVLHGVEYEYGFPPSELFHIVKFNTKLKNYDRTNSWGEVSRSEWRKYISVYPRLYQVRPVSKGRIEKWLGIDDNRATFQSWGSTFRAFLRTELEDQRTNTHVRRPGIPPEATWLNEEHRLRGEAFDIKKRRLVTAPAQEEEEGDDASEVAVEEEEEQKHQIPAGGQRESEEAVEQPRGTTHESNNGPNISQRPNKRKREDQDFSTVVGTPFPPALLASLPPHLRNQSKEQYAHAELRAAAVGFRNLYSDVLQVAQELDASDPLRPLLSHVANSASLDVVRAERAARTSSELLKSLATAQAEAVRTYEPDEEMRIKRARARAAYEMLPNVAPAHSHRHPQREHARTRQVQGQIPNHSLTRDNSQVPEADDNVRSLTVPREESSPSGGYELPDHLVDNLRYMFEPSSSDRFGPPSSPAGGAGDSHPNTAADVQSSRSHSRGTPAFASTGVSSHHRVPSGEFSPAITVDNNNVIAQQPPRLQPQPRPQLRRTTTTSFDSIPVNSVEAPSYHSLPSYPPPSRSHSERPHATHQPPAVNLPRLPPTVEPTPIQPPPLGPPSFGPANRRITTRATSAQAAPQPQTQQPRRVQTWQSSQETQASSTRQTRQSSQQPQPAPSVASSTSSSSLSRDPLRATAGQARGQRSFRGNRQRGGKSKSGGAHTRIVEEVEEGEEGEEENEREE